MLVDMSVFRPITDTDKKLSPADFGAHFHAEVCVIKLLSFLCHDDATFDKDRLNGENGKALSGFAVPLVVPHQSSTRPTTTSYAHRRSPSRCPEFDTDIKIHVHKGKGDT